MIAPPGSLAEAWAMNGHWLCDTPQGVFRIARTRLAQRECFAVLLDDALLGTCDTAEQGLRLLTQDRAYKAACGLDISRLPIPTSLAGWTFAPAS